MAFFISNNARSFMFHASTAAKGLAALTVLVSAMAQAQTPLPYRSVFEGYQPFTDNKLTPWAESNDAVAQAGGWRAYAKEAAAPAAQAASSPPAAPTPAAGGKPAAAQPHAGHGQH
jgi:hypothetical protein